MSKVSTGIFVIATMLAGTLSPMQSAVNGEAGKFMNDGHASAVISGSGAFILMAIMVLSRKETRQQFLAIPKVMRSHTIPVWNWFAGLVGAMVIFSEGVAVSTLGVAIFQTSLIAASVLSCLLCDRFGIGVEEKKFFTAKRIVGAIIAITAAMVVVSPQWEQPHYIILAILPILAGLGAGWQPAGNSTVAKATGSMTTAIAWNIVVGYSVLLIPFIFRLIIGDIHLNLPDHWWMYLGGPLGCSSIACMAFLVRGIGLLLLGIASTAGQLIGSVIIDLAFPSLGHEVYTSTFIGIALTLAGTIIVALPEKKKANAQA